MKILSINISGHDTSCTILTSGKIEYYIQSERISRKKHDADFINILYRLKQNKKNNFDVILVAVFKRCTIVQNPYDEFTFQLNKLGIDYKKLFFQSTEHHLYHAYNGFCNSPFDEALCFVLDGAGAESVVDKTRWLERESVYLMSRSIPFLKTIHQGVVETNWKTGMCIKYPEKNSVGGKFETLARSMGFSGLCGGKVMGLAQCMGYEKYVDSKWRDDIETAKKLQKETEDEVISLIKKSTQKTGLKNIVLTGGYALNCVANYRFKKEFKDLKFFIDPICADSGISIGQAYEYYIRTTLQFPKKNKSIYLGTPVQIDSSKFFEKIYKKTSYDEVSKLLMEGEVVALVQGKSESGYRALGNRSILMDPRIEDGRDRLNKIKGREKFRPFAGTVLQQFASKWFDVDESSYMSYAVKVKKEGIPSMVHYDNTCRVQTLTREQNIHFYDLIESFYKKTGIPMLLNTSLNNAGEAIAETFEHAMSTCVRMNLNYIFFPEKMLLLDINSMTGFDREKFGYLK